jgi:predicted Co/Zn/Cd cation transporter (cation efflux family)
MTLNYIAIIITALVHYGIGSVYYTVFAENWSRARGYASRAELMKKGMKNWSFAGPFILTFFYSFIYSFVLASILQLTPEHTVSSGIMYGFLIWIGFFMTGLIFNYSYADQKKSLIAFDGGYWLISTIICGIILSVWR